MIETLKITNYFFLWESLNYKPAYGIKLIMHDVNGFCVDIYTVIFPQELQELFSAFDKDGSGVIDFDEFLLALRVSLRGIGTIPRL